MAKKLTGISDYFNSKGAKPVGETVVREAFLRAAKEQLDNFGIDKYSVERLQGMISLLEQYSLAQEEIDNI